MDPRALVTGAPAPTPTLLYRTSNCQAVNLPANGVLSIPGTGLVTLTAAAAFRPACTDGTQPAIIANGGVTGGSAVFGESTVVDDVTSPQLSDFFDPFYASTFPQCYALAATTVVAYTLCIMLFITPRSFLDGGVVVLGRRGGFTSGGTGGTNIGGRPWLQKVAAISVAISLTIATADTFRVAQEQYEGGFQNAKTMQADVLGSTELKAIRIVSEAFLWLAQAQTLTRLFPRQREKIIIKWTAFALIALGVIFDSLDSFLYTSNGATHPRSFTDAIPALSYLFQLSLGVLYAAWVIYYSLMKKRFAFYHRQMRNIGLVALLSIGAIFVPVVFFILDISKPDFTGWGDYVRWVGAAAASVIVWEWVERIEALEREEKKDGILGREVFDGDEMLEITPSDLMWPRRRKNKKPKDDDGGEGGGATAGIAATSGRSKMWPTMSSIANRYRSQTDPQGDGMSREGESTVAPRTERPTIRFLQPPLWPARPPPAVTPVSRTDTTSADSTVYAIRFHPVSESASDPIPESQEGRHSRSNSSDNHNSHGGDPETRPGITPEPSASASQAPSSSTNNRWRAITQANHLFRRGTRSSQSGEDARSRDRSVHHEEAGWRDIRSRFEEFAVTQAERLRERIRPTPDTDSLPITVIPAPPRQGAALAQLMEEEELQRAPESLDQPSTQTNRHDSGASPSLPARGSASSPDPSGPATWRSDSGASFSSMSRPVPLSIQDFSHPPSREPLPLAVRASTRRVSEPGGGSLPTAGDAADHPDAA